VPQASQLAAVLRRYDMASHVNVIQWNPVDESAYQRPDKPAVKAFMATLEAAGMAVSFRTTRGMEAAAACGQLRNQHQKDVLPEPARLA
jgi:23S rRNA (adenine2503-C2)-methyltransferase